MKLLLLFLLLTLSGFSFGQDKSYFDGSDSCQFKVNNQVFPNSEQNEGGKFWVKTNCQIKTYKLQIFNRWGENVFTSENIDENWNCADQKEGAFYYILSGKYINNEEFSFNGFFHILN